MVPRPLPKDRQTSPRRLKWRFAWALAHLCVCSLLQAQTIPDRQRTTHVALNARGGIGAWLFGGPCGGIKEIPPTAAPGTRAACAGARWQHAVSASAQFDWSASLQLPANTPAAVAAGVWLHVPRAFDGWLLIAADGKLRVAVDGRWIHRRERTQQRGRAFVPVRLSLSAGFHPILLALERSGNRAGLEVLLRERRTNQAPLDATLYLPGAPSADRLLEGLLTADLAISGDATSVGLDMELAFPSCGPKNDLPVTIELHQKRETEQTRHLWSVGVFESGTARTDTFRLHLAPLDSLAASGDSKIVVRFGDSSIQRRLRVTPEAIRSLKEAKRALHALESQKSGSDPFDAAAATLEGHWARVVEQMLRPSGDALGEAVRNLDRLVDDFAQGRNPFRQPGYVNAYIRSNFDDRPTSVLTHVPEDLLTDDTTTRPLVMLLHGYNSNPRRMLDAFLDIKTTGTKPVVPGFVIAPAAYGNSFYRGAGEQAVLAALDWALDTYPIDDSRVSITGVSMGGTGAAEIAFRNSSRFAAAAPLCGYQSYFVRRDTANRPLRPWERKLMHRFSPASLADSGADVPLFVAHGTRDFPLENSKVLTRRYRSLGYDLTEDWPNLGHAVWKKTYRNAGMYFWLTKWQKDKDPTRVVLATPSVAQGKKFWLALTELDSTEEPSLIDARINSPTEILIRSRGVLGFRVGESRHLDLHARHEISIDGESLWLEPGGTRQFSRIGGHWQLVKPAPDDPAPAPPVEGPWAELFAAPFAVVYGTGNPSATALNREVAERLVAPRPGVDLQPKIIADHDFQPGRSTLTRVIYVGRPDDHEHLAAIQADLPIRVTSEGIEVGALRFPEPDVGVAFVYPDPNHRERLLGVVSANGAEGLWRVLALPALIPDFVVFDHDVDAAAGEPVLGAGAFLRAAGFFRPGWSLPVDLLDPMATEAP